MKNINKLLFAGGLLLLMNFVVCGPPKPVAESGECSPTDLVVKVDKGMMDVSWKADCTGLISGYNIYISDEPLANKYPGNEFSSDIEAHNTSPFAGDTNPEDGVEHYQADRLEDGQKYYVSVRVLYPDMTLSKPTFEKVVVCGARGEMELSIRYKSNQDGYSFEMDEYVRAEKLENDLYFFSKDGKDYLNSPSKLDAFLKANVLKKISAKGDLNQVAQTLSKLSKPDDFKIEVKKGDWIWLLTDDDKSVLIKVLNVSGQGEKRKVKLYFAYSSLAGELIF
jgi:hypothetical protein